MMSFKEFKATVCTPKVAGPQNDNRTITTTTKKSDSAKDLTSTQSSASLSSPASSISSTVTTSIQEETHMKMCKLFSFIDDTYHDIRRYNSGLYKDSYSTKIMQTINKYKNGCNEIFGKVLESYDMSFKLSQNIVRTIDIFKELCSCLTDTEEYQYRICEIMSIFIVCELRLSVEAGPQEQLLIAHRIIYIMRRHLVQEEENETLYNILRTLVYIPKLFNARDIMCAIFGEFIPIKPVPEVNVLPDKLYMLYIIVFYRWMMMQKDDDDKLLIVNFAESFMKPSVSLCSNNLYGAYLPMYTTHSTATRTILNNLKYYRDIRNACMIDNALKKLGSVVNLCDDDEEDDIIVLDSSSSTDFAQAYASVVNLEPLSGSLSNIKLEEKTIVDTVDLTSDEEALNSSNSLIERHDKWLNEFQQLAKQYRESQLILEKQQNNQMISQAVICLDSDSEEEEEAELTASNTKETSSAARPALAECSKTAAQTNSNNCEDLFVDNYPLTTTPINCDTDIESLEAEEDADDETKISSRFLSGTLRTYQAKKNNNVQELEHRNNTDVESEEPETDVNTLVGSNKSTDCNKAYRRDSIHISSTPPENADNEEDEGTDVQDEHDDDILEDEEEANAYTFLPTATSKKPDKEIFAKQIKPMGPYPTYNNLHSSNNNDKVVFSQTLTRYHHHQQQHHQPNTQHQEKQYYSDSWDIQTNKKQKKRVQFNTSPLGPTGSSSSQKAPLKPALQQQKYKASDAPEYFHLRGFERFSCAPSIAGSTSTSASNSTSSSIKHQEQQEHLAAAATLFRNIFDRPPRLPYTYTGPFSPTSSSISSRSLTSPATTPNTPQSSRKKTRLPKNKKQAIKQRRPTMGTREDLNSTNSSGHNEEQYSIIRNREVLKDSGYRSATGGPPGMPSYGCYSSDDYYGVQSDSDIIINERYKNDAKLRKRCAVVITPTEELIQYERKRDQMYNEILQKQRRKLELRALEKQREKERRRLGRREEKRDKNTVKGTTATTTAVAVERDRDKIPRRRGKNYNEIFMSSESEFETNFQVRTRKQRQQNVKELQQPLNIQVEMTDVTSSLLSQIEAHLDKPETKKTEKQQQKEKESRLEQQPNNNNTENDINQQQCDITDKSQQTKMRELNLLADIAQHLSPYQLDLPENNNTNINNPSTTPLPAQPQTQAVAETPPTQNTIKAKEKITVTEHLIIIQSLDNLLEKPETQLVTKEHEQEHEHDQKQEDQQLMATPSYAHEPKLNIAAILNSSPNRTQNQENNTPTKENDNSLDDEHNTDQILKANIPSDDALEQILEESISVLKSVTSPYNPLNECTPQTPAETTIPLLISNVESLNNFQHESTEATNKKSLSQDKEHLIENERERKANNENVILRENGKESNEKSKDVAEEQNKNLTSSLLNTVDSSIMCSTDLSNISVETEITNALKVPPLMPADLSDISLESEISKHLPDIAEPSPVVTDMSDNSNASDVSKAFSLDTRQPMINNSIQNANDVTVMSLPVLPLVMPNMPSTPTTLSTTGEQHGTALESNFGPLNSTLNTPTKLAVLNREEELRNSHLSNDLNTPLKFPIQPAELSGDNMPLKNTLEPEADNNVTKFLDLILNKTVTDAESETRDKIIKELNALTADSTAAITETQGTGNKNEIRENLECENDKNKQLGITEAIMENSNSNEEKATKNINVIKEQGNLELECLKTQETVLYFSSEKDKTSTENIELAKRHEHEESSLQETLANNEVNPPKENIEELQTEEITDSELTSSTTSSEVKSATKMKTAIKQTFNIKCRVRLKRLNIDDHYKSSRKETWMAIPLAKPEEKELNTNVENMTNCDILTESTTSLMKKPCLKYNNNNNKRTGEEMDIKGKENDIEAIDKDLDTDETAAKKLKLEDEQNSTTSAAIQTSTLSQPIQTQMPILEASQATPTLLFNTTTNSSSSSSTTTTSNTPTSSKSKTKPLKTVTFDLSNLNEELRDTSTFGHKKSSKNHAATIAAGAMGCYLKNSRPPRKLPDNTLRAAETLQIFVNTLNDSTRTPPPAEFNKKRSPIKNKCIAEDETPRPPPAATLMGTPPCKKNCTEKSRSQISSSKCKDQLVSSLATPTISTITSDITTARIYTSSPLDQTLPEYDDNVDTVADSELILPTTTGSLRRKLKRPKKSLTRPEPADDISTDDISNQPECNGEDDTDAVVDNEDDVFAEELLPIPAANEHILEEIVSARPSHMGSGTVIRDDYMNIEATATVPVYLFNDESRDLATPEPIQSSDTTNVVDSSSYLNTSSNSITNTVVAAAATTASTSSTMGSLEKSMLSPSEHEVSSTQETFYQTPTKSKQNETFGDKSSSNKDKSASGSSSLSASQKLKAEENNFQNKEDDQTSSTTGLLQNNQVDTTNHSPEMCTLTLTPTTTTTTSSTTAMTSNRKIRKASTHDEILFNELQQQQQQQQQQQLPTNKRKTNLTTTTSCAESTSDHNSNSNTSKMKIITNNLEEHSKSNGSLAKVEDKFKKLLKEVCKRDKNQSSNEINITDIAGGNIGSGSGGGGGGGSSPSTTTTINEEKLSRSKRKKQKSSKSSKTKNHTERSTKIVLKASKLAAHIPASNPLIITIPKSRLLRPPPTPTPPTPTESQQDIFQQQENEFLNIPNAKLFIEKEKETTTTTTMAMAMTTTPLPPSAIKNNNHHQQQHHNHQHHTKHNATTHINKIEHTPVAVVGKSSKRTLSPAPTITDNVNTKYNINSETFKLENSINTNSAIPASKEKSFSSTLTSKKKPKTSSNSSSTNTATCGTTNSINSNKNSNSNLVFVKDKYDLIKSKDKYHHNHHYSELIEQNKEKKDKTGSYSSQSLKATTSSSSSSSSANTRLHKSSSKEKVKGEKVKEKHKTTEKELAVKLNTTESSINKTLNTLSSSNSKQSNSSKSNKNSSSSNFSHSTSASNAAILKSKTNINNSSTLLSAANIQQINNSASSTSTSISASASSSPSVTISNNHHVRKKLKTK